MELSGGAVLRKLGESWKNDFSFKQPGAGAGAAYLPNEADLAIRGIATWRLLPRSRKDVEKFDS